MTALELVSVIVIGGTVSGFTPISTTGALIMAGVAQQENATKFPQKPPVCGAVCGVLSVRVPFWLFAFIGIYDSNPVISNKSDYSIFRSF